MSYYADVLDGLVYSACPNTDPDVTNRCVESDSSSVARLALQRGLDPDGDEVQEQLKECIVAADYRCPEGRCERSSNCHWKEILPGSTQRSRRGDAGEDYADPNPRTNPYLSSILPFLAAGSVFAVGTALGWIAFACLRFFCTSRANRFCSPVPKEEYSVRDVWMPKAGYVLFCVGAIAGALTFALRLSKVPTVGDATLTHMQQALTDANLKFKDLGVAVDSLSTDVQRLTEEVASKVEDSDVVEKFGEDMGGQLNIFEEDFSDVLGEGDNVISQLRAELDARIGDVEEDKDKAVDLLRSGVQEALVDPSSSALDTLMEASSSLNAPMQLLSSMRSALEQQELTSNISGVVVAWTLITCMVGLALILAPRFTSCRVDRALNAVWISGAILGILAFVLSGATMVLSVLNHDFCYVTDASVKSGFEPIIGQTWATATKSCFQQQHLIQAYRWNSFTYISQSQKEDIISTDQIDAGIDELLALLDDAQAEIDKNRVEGLNTLNDKISEYNDVLNDNIIDAGDNSNICPFLEQFESAQTSLEPWDNNRDTRGSTTSWVQKDTGTVGSYARQGDETNVEYIERIYNIAGVCTSVVGADCILTANGIDTAVVFQETCNSGINCEYFCEEPMQEVFTQYSNYVNLMETAERATANLGVTCPPGRICPDPAFAAAGHPKTTAETVRAFGTEATDLLSSLLDEEGLAGGLQDASAPVLCELECFFLAQAMQEVGEDLCVDLLDHVVGLSVALFFLGICLQGAGAFAAVLCVRLKPQRRADYGVPVPISPSRRRPPRKQQSSASSKTSNLSPNLSSNLSSPKKPKRAKPQARPAGDPEDGTGSFVQESVVSNISPSAPPFYGP